MLKGTGYAKVCLVSHAICGVPGLLLAEIPIFETRSIGSYLGANSIYMPSQHETYDIIAYLILSPDLKNRTDE